MSIAVENNTILYQTCKPLAICIIHGLSITSLTIGDIKTPIGLTAEDLRDELYIKLAWKTDKPLQKIWQHTSNYLRGNSKTVSGKFISKNLDNQQYYLDRKN